MPQLRVHGRVAAAKMAALHTVGAGGFLGAWQKEDKGQRIGDEGQRTKDRARTILCLQSFVLYPLTLPGLGSHVRAPVSASPAADQRAGG